MRIRTIHRAVTVGAELHTFADVGGGFFEGDVPDEVGETLLGIAATPVEYARLDDPGQDTGQEGAVVGEAGEDVQPEGGEPPEGEDSPEGQHEVSPLDPMTRREARRRR